MLLTRLVFKEVKTANTMGAGFQITFLWRILFVFDIFAFRTLVFELTVAIVYRIQGAQTILEYLAAVIDMEVEKSV